MVYQTVLKSLAVCGVLVLSACAELNSALDTANSVLGTVNETVGSVSNVGSGSGKYKIGNRSTAQYEMTNLTIGVDQEVSSGGVGTGHLSVGYSGHIRNKTDKNLRVTFRLPFYDKDGDLVYTSIAEISVPPREKMKINGSSVNMQWYQTAKPNLSKFQISTNTRF